MQKPGLRSASIAAIPRQASGHGMARGIRRLTAWSRDQIEVSSSFLAPIRANVPDHLRRAALQHLLRYQLRRSMGRLGLHPSFGSTEATPTRHRADVTLVRERGRIHFGLPPDPTHMVFAQREVITAYLYLLLHCPPSVTAMTCDCSDGHEASEARFSPSSRNPRAIPVPDHYFILRNGFAAERAMAESITSIRRAGADVVITYWAREMVRYIGRRV